MRCVRLYRAFVFGDSVSLLVGSRGEAVSPVRPSTETKHTYRPGPLAVGGLREACPGYHRQARGSTFDKPP